MLKERLIKKNPNYSMKKSLKRPIWMRLIPVILLVSIPVIDYIYRFQLEPSHSIEGTMMDLVALIYLYVIPVIFLSIMIFFLPLVGGILALLATVLNIFNPDNPYLPFAWYFFAALFLAGLSGLYIGIWNFKNKSKVKTNPQNKSSN